MAKLQAQRSNSGDSATVPGLTHQNSAESVKSPITPNIELNRNPVANPKIMIAAADQHNDLDGPLSAPSTTTVFKTEHANNSEPMLPPKDLPFLQHDPYAEDDIVPFDKNKPIKPSRSGSVRSIMSTSSMQSIKRSFSSLKRKLTTRGSRKGRPKPTRNLTVPEDGSEMLKPPPRSMTYMHDAGTFRGPARVETFQVSSMAF